MAPPVPLKVQTAFDGYPAAARRTLLDVRRLLYEVAAAEQAIGPIDETLKWGEPTYLTPSGAGSTIRLGWSRKRPGKAAIYFICRTSLVDAFRARFGDELTFEGDRAIVLDPAAPLPRDAISACLMMALTYKIGRGRSRAVVS